MKKSINYFDDLEDKPTPVLQEIAVMPGIGSTISVRSAKAHFSALLDLVARGREITITSGGKPKALKLTKTQIAQQLTQLEHQKAEIDKAISRLKSMQRAA